MNDQPIVAGIDITEADRATMLEKSAGFENLYEGLQNFARNLHPSEFATMLLARLPGLDDPKGRMTGEDFETWAIIARELGPDWLAQFKRVSLYMNAVDRGEF